MIKYMRAFTDFVNNEVHNSRNNIEGTLYFEGLAMNEEQCYVSLCPENKGINHIPNFISTCSNHNILVIRDEYKTDGNHGYIEYHKILLDFGKYKEKRENLLNDIIEAVIE